MGKGGKVTVGYWYHPTFHICLHNGPMDALYTVRAGGYDAWDGQLLASGTITIDAPNLWGGEAAEGGIQGDMDVMFGDEDQAPNGNIDSLIAPDGSAHRGKACILFKGGRYGAMNPYPKPISFMTQRIAKGWDNDDCWYPAKVAIPLVDSSGSLYSTVVTDTQFNVHDSGPGISPHAIIVNVPSTGFLVRLTWLGPDGIYPAFWSPGFQWQVHAYVAKGTGSPPVYGAPSSYIPPAAVGPLTDGGWASEAAAAAAARGQSVVLTGGTSYAIGVYHPDADPAGDGPTAEGDLGGLSVQVDIAPPINIFGSNPAHIIYESLTASDMGAEPIANISDASFTAAADQLYTEGLGLCTLYDPDQETLEQFRERICSAAAVSCTRSSIDGLWYLDLIRGGGDPSLLPVLTDDDILDYQEDVSSQDDTVNQVAVQWFDPVMNQQRTTAPVQAVGAIESFEIINAQVNQYPEIPMESLALRAAARDLGSLSLPLKRLTLTTNRTPYGWRSGTYFVLNAPKRGIESAVFLVGDIDRGTLKSGAIQIKAVQDNYSMPSTTYVTGESGNGASLQPAPPVPVVNQLAFEIPYAILAQNLTATQLGALEDDAGYLGLLGVRPQAATAGYNFEVAVGASAYAVAGQGDWCPSATATNAAGPFDTSAALSAPVDLQYVLVGTAALWENEIVRVDAVNVSTNTVTLGRGCADTVPATHGAASRIYFAGGAISSDQVEYVVSEVVSARLLTRSAGAILSDLFATDLSVTMAKRQALPYPPQMLMVNGTRWDEVTGAQTGLVLSWARRNRITQADQLIDCTAADIAPEASTTFTVRIVDQTGAVLLEQTNIAGTTFTWNPASTVQAKVSVVAVSPEGTSSQGQTSLLMTVANNASAPSGGGGVPGLVPATGGQVVQVLVGALADLFIAATVSAATPYAAQWQDSPDGNTFTNRSTSGAPISVAALWPYALSSGSKIYLPAYVSDDANWYDSPWSELTLTAANFPNLTATLSGAGLGTIGTVWAPSQIWNLNGQWVVCGYLGLALSPYGIAIDENPIMQYVLLSSDGTTWVDQSGPSPGLQLLVNPNSVELLWDSVNSRYLIFVTNGADLKTSTDLNTLTDVPAFATAVGSGITNYTRGIEGIATDGAGTIVVVGFGWYTPDGHTITDSAPWIVRSTDNGTTWAAVTYTGPNPPERLTGVLWDGGRFVAKGIGVLGSSPDGSTWTWVSTFDSYDYNWATNGANVTLYQEYDAGTFSFGPIKRLVGSTPILDESGGNITDESSNNILSD